MKKTYSTKRSLIASILVLCLCLTSFVGTTYAWFTDSVTSENNIIKSGNLDIELEYAVFNEDGTFKEWKDVENASDILTNLLWEPGVAEVAYLRVANAGSLALKYQLGINITETPGVNAADQEFLLSNYIQFGVVENVNGETGKYANREAAIDAVDAAKKISAGYTKSTSMTAGQALYLALVVWMPEEVGNEANHNGTDVPQINLGINIVATQMTAESDSFGPDYDDGAFIPVAPEALPANPDSTTVLAVKGSAESNVTVKVPATVLAGLHEEVTSLSVAASKPIVNTENKTISFSTVELVDQNGEEVDIAATGAKVTVILPVEGAFANGEKVEVYHDGSFVTYATVENGNISYEVSHFCEVSIKSAEEVVLDNTIDSVKEFIAFANAVNAGTSYAGQTVTLGADLDLNGVTWTPIGTSTNPFKGTFDGNGKVIKNLSVLMAGKSNVGLFGMTTDGEIKNLTIENAKVAGRLNVGVVAGQPYTTKYTNITLTGHVEVNGMAYVGGIGGKNAYSDWTNIAIDVDETSYVKAYSIENGTAYRTYVGGVIGFMGEGGHTVSNVTSNIDVIGSTCDVGGIVGIAHYGNNFVNITCTGNVTITDAEEAGEVEEMGGIAGVWHNQNGYTVTLTNCKFTGTLTANITEGVDLSNNTLVGASYNNTGAGKLNIDGVAGVVVEETFIEEIAAGNKVILFADIVMTETFAQKNANIDIDGNGFTITQSADCVNNIALFDLTGGKATIKNVTFDGIKGGAVIRTVGVEFNADNIVVKNCAVTQKQGLLRLMGKSTITNSTFANNTCNMVITFNYDGANSDPQVLKNCVFESNICNTTAVVYYVKGAGATIMGNKFLNNTVYSTGNAATLYMGFTENNMIINNVFQGNSVTTTDATTKRAAGALMIGYDAVIIGNAFVDNTVTGTNAKANNVCASVYYTDIDLSGNYWGGSAPVENDDYFVEFPDNNKVIINYHLTQYAN